MSNWIIKTKQSLKRGLILKKVHAVIKSKQKRLLESYISLNIWFRTITENNFEQNNNKLKFNSVFGRSIHSDRNEKDMRIVSNKK